MVCVVLWLIADNAPDTPIPVCSETFVGFDMKFGAHSNLTDLQKDHQIEEEKGHRVRWEGIVSYVSDDSVGVKHKATTLTYDVLLEVPRKYREDLPLLNQGDKVTYEGTIKDYGTILPVSLNDGRIISHESMSAGDRMIFLTNTETEIMNRIAGR
jgi:hypothetical protein